MSEIIITQFIPNAVEAYTNKPAMVIGPDRYLVPGDDGVGFLICAGSPDADDSETIDGPKELSEIPELRTNERLK